MCNACHQAAKGIIPKPMKNGMKNNKEIAKLSKQQQKLKMIWNQQKTPKNNTKLKKRFKGK